MSFKNRKFRETVGVVVVFLVLAVVGSALAVSPITRNRAKGLNTDAAGLPVDAAASLDITYKTGTDKQALVVALPQVAVAKAQKIDDKNFTLDPRAGTAAKPSALGNIGYIHVETNSSKWDLMVSSKNGGRLIRALEPGETDEVAPWAGAPTYTCNRREDQYFLGYLTGNVCVDSTMNPIEMLGGKYLMVDSVGPATKKKSWKPALLEFGIGTVATTADGFLAGPGVTTALYPMYTSGTLNDTSKAESFVKVMFNQGNSKRDISLADSLWSVLSVGPTAGRINRQDVSALGLLTTRTSLYATPAAAVYNTRTKGFPKILQRDDFAAAGGIDANGVASLEDTAWTGVPHLSTYSYQGIVSMVDNPAFKLNGMLFYVNAKFVDATLDEALTAAAGHPYGVNVGDPGYCPISDDPADDGKTEYKETLTFTFWCAD